MRSSVLLPELLVYSVRVVNHGDIIIKYESLERVKMKFSITIRQLKFLLNEVDCSTVPCEDCHTNNTCEEESRNIRDDATITITQNDD